MASLNTNVTMKMDNTQLIRLEKALDGVRQAILSLEKSLDKVYPDTEEAKKELDGPT